MFDTQRRVIYELAVGTPSMLLCLCVLAFSQPFFGQSLGDVARKERQKQQSRDTRPAKKVISDEDMPDDPASEFPQSLSKDHKSSDSALDLSSEDGKKSAQQWKAEIQAQKNLVASLQKALDRLNSSIHFVDANRYVGGAQYNQTQIQRQQRTQQVQAQQDEQKQKLEAMQEAARRAGFGNAVYDP